MAINETDEDYTSFDEESMVETVGRNVMLYVYASIFVVGLLGNLWVLYLIGKSRQAKTITNIFIFNLGVADLFYMLCLPIIITRMVIGEWIFGLFLCKLYFTFDGINKFASVAFLVLLSLDRYMAICHPLTSRNFRTTNAAVVLAATTWTIVVLLMMPVFLFATVLEHEVGTNSNETKFVCMFPLEQSENGTNTIEPRRVFTFYTFTLSYLLPLMLICIFYLLIVCRLRRQEKLFPDTKQDKNAIVSRNIRRKKRTSRQISVMVLMIVAAYTFCWLPYWFLQIGLELFPDTLVELGDGFQLFSFISYGLQISNSALNPFLYALGTESHRRDMISFVRKCFKCPQNESNPSQVLSNGEKSHLLAEPVGTFVHGRRNRLRSFRYRNRTQSNIESSHKKISNKFKRKHSECLNSLAVDHL